VLTFEPHPREVFRPDDPPFRLTLSAERADALAALGVHILYELPFNHEFSLMTADAFVASVLHEGIGARHLVSGQDFASFLQERILTPLGMRDTGFALSDDMARRLVGTHSRGPDGTPVSISFEFPQDADLHSGGGGLFSTAPDYLAFTRMLLAGGTLDGVQVLKPETVKLMASNAIGDLEVPMMRSNNPSLALEVETFPGQVKKWGLTFLINTEDAEGFRAAGSLTWGGIHNTYFWIDLKRRMSAVAMMQILPIGDPHVLRTMIAFEQALYAAGSRT